MFERSAGILLHPTSLPGRYGIGDLGNEAYNFINFLEAAGQTIWQVFPLGPTGYGDSPYQSFSTFAGNPLIISPQALAEDGLLTYQDLENVPDFDPNDIDFGRVIPYKFSLLSKAYKKFLVSSQPKDDYAEFCRENASWLEDYALFMAVKVHHGGVSWTQWDKDIAFRKDGAVEKWRNKLQIEVDYYKFIQFEFFKQWKAIKIYANEKNIKIIGDIPIYIPYDSTDCWANKELFSVDKKGKLEKVGGVPPDYFSATGQLWGNPLYRWDVMEKDDFAWWKKRISNMLGLVDIIRIDHFRGLEAYWEIPGNAPTAQTGRWLKAPGEKLFNSIKKHLGSLPIIAEDLGVITKEVEHLRDQFEFPGMKILQFAFGKDMENKFLPHNFTKNCIVMTGSHDNDTTRGYYERVKNDGSDIYEFTQKYLDYYGEDITAELIRTAYSSVANLVVIPMQDILNLGNKARMNFPGKVGGNWTWRFRWDMVPYDISGKYKAMMEIYDRPPLRKHEDEKIETE
jgi:4-alpha-glucanotransferase